MIIQFLWVRNSEAALIDGSGQKSFSTWFLKKKNLYLFIWPSYVAFGRSLTRDWTPVAAVKAQNLNRWDCQGISQKSFLMLQEICQVGCSYLKARLGLIDLFHSGWLTWCWLLGGGLSSFPHGPLQAPLSILTTWWLASPVWEFQEKAKHKSLCFLWLSHGNHGLSFLHFPIGYTDQLFIAGEWYSQECEYQKTWVVGPSWRLGYNHPIPQQPI